MYRDIPSEAARTTIAITLSDAEMTAVKEWREANLMPSDGEALRELIRLGLLSEIAKVHRLVTSIRSSVRHVDGDC